MKDLRALAVAIGDALAVLSDTPLNKYPTLGGLSFEEKAAQVSKRTAELALRTRQGWKAKILELVQRELTQAIEKGREGDDEGSHRLFVDAEMHFRQYERGEEPRITFIAGPNGDLVKSNE